MSRIVISEVLWVGPAQGAGKDFGEQQQHEGGWRRKEPPIFYSWWRLYFLWQLDQSNQNVLIIPSKGLAAHQWEGSANANPLLDPGSGCPTLIDPPPLSFPPSSFPFALDLIHHVQPVFQLTNSHQSKFPFAQNNQPSVLKTSIFHSELCCSRFPNPEGGIGPSFWSPLQHPTASLQTPGGDSRSDFIGSNKFYLLSTD